jgi:hypothetical protein
MTPSLAGFFWSLVFGGTVLGAIFIGVLVIANIDSLKRG